MNWVDLAIIGVIGVSALVGLARGLLREVLSLVVWLGALGIGYRFHREVADWLTFVDQPTARLAIAFAILVLAVLILGGILGALLSALISRVGLRGVDRVLGGVFGAARGGVIVAMAVFLGALTPVAEEPWWDNSPSIAYFRGTADWLLSLIPADLQNQLKKV